MGWLKLLWGTGRPADVVSHEEFERVKREYDRKLEELDEAIHALRDHEPDERRQSYAP
jgi:hypothetical protein